MTSYLYIKSPLLFNPNKLQKEVQVIIQTLISQKELEKDWDSITLPEVSFKEDSYLSYVLNFFDAPKESIELKKVSPTQDDPESPSYEGGSEIVPVYIPINAPGNSICRLNQQNVRMASGECWIIPNSSSFSTLHMAQIHLCINLRPSSWTHGFISLGERFTHEDESIQNEKSLSPIEKGIRPNYFHRLLPWTS